MTFFPPWKLCVHFQKFLCYLGGLQRLRFCIYCRNLSKLNVEKYIIYTFWCSIRIAYLKAPVWQALKSVLNFFLSHNLVNFSKAFACFKSRNCFKILMKQRWKVALPIQSTRTIQVFFPFNCRSSALCSPWELLFLNNFPTFWNAPCTDNIYQHSSKCLNTSKE